MPWTFDHCPPSMKHLPLPVRAKAVEIANAVLAHDGDEAKAIRIGIAKAKEWAARCDPGNAVEDPIPPPWE